MIVNSRTTEVESCRCVQTPILRFRQREINRSPVDRGSVLIKCSNHFESCFVFQEIDQSAADI